jgi:hypothetical protein
VNLKSFIIVHFIPYLSLYISPFKIYIQKEIPMLENLLEFTGSQTVPPRRRSLVASFRKTRSFGSELRAQGSVAVGEYL